MIGFGHELEEVEFPTKKFESSMYHESAVPSVAVLAQAAEPESAERLESDSPDPFSVISVD
jgi:hypothetical protein